MLPARYLFAALFLCLSFQCFSQGVVRVRNITITGNRHTRTYIIKRELDIKEGDTIALKDVAQKLERGRQHIYNTTLFVDVKTAFATVDSSTIDVVIIVKERWYIFPIPEFGLVDRSLDEWLTKYHGDLNRVNYGVSFIHKNLTGRKDPLSIKLQSGYTQNLSFSYRAPANRALTNGYGVGAGYSRTREISYKTSFDNNLVYYDSPDFVRKAWSLQAAYSIRKRIKKSETFGISYNDVTVTDSIIAPKYDPHYFNTPSAHVNFVDLSYVFQYNDVDQIAYPLKGFTVTLEALKRGFDLSGGISMTSLRAEYDKYWPLGKKWYTSMQVQGRIKLPFDQPYYNQSALGYGNSYLRGLDYSIIDAVAYALAKFNLKRELFNFSVNTPFKKSKTLNKIPFRFYAKTYADFGYAYIPDPYVSQLNNTLLYSGGFGLDIVTFYDVQFRLEYSFNQLGRSRLFMRNERGF